MTSPSHTARVDSNHFRILCLPVVAAACFLSACSSPPILRLDAEALDRRLTNDLEAVRVYRRGLASVLEFIETKPKAPPRPGEDILSLEERQLILST